MLLSQLLIQNHNVARRKIPCFDHGHQGFGYLFPERRKPFPFMASHYQCETKLHIRKIYCPECSR